MISDVNSIRKSFRHIPQLETDRLILRKILVSDARDMYEYSKNPETSRYLLWDPHPSLFYTRFFIRHLQRKYAKGQFFDWALIEKQSKKMIGTCGFTEIYEDSLSCEVGYVLSPRFHRRGLAPEALRCVLQYGFETLGLKKASGRIMADNAASRKVLLRFGFWEDATRDEEILKNGKMQKIQTYSLLREEFSGR